MREGSPLPALRVRGYYPENFKSLNDKYHDLVHMHMMHTLCGECQYYNITGSHSISAGNARSFMTLTQTYEHWCSNRATVTIHPKTPVTSSPALSYVSLNVLTELLTAKARSTVDQCLICWRCNFVRMSPAALCFSIQNSRPRLPPLP